jgi:outer membrane protein W
MKKVFYTTITICLLTFTGQSQVSATLNGGIFLPPDIEETFLGANLALKYDLTDDMRAGLSLGWYNYSEGDSDFKVGISYMPISALYEYRFLNGAFRPYAGINAGLYMTSVRVSFLGESDSDSVADFGFAPVIGADYAISDNFGINFNAKYHFILDGGDEYENTTAIAINLGVTYSF